MEFVLVHILVHIVILVLRAVHIFVQVILPDEDSWCCGCRLCKYCNMICEV
jgi:hypothetical protein